MERYDTGHLRKCASRPRSLAELVDALKRDIRRLVAEGAFEFEQVGQYYMRGPPKFAAFMTRGIARACP